jgi:hypothetical protein
VGDWVEGRAHQILSDRARALSDVERQTTSSVVRPAFASGFPHSNSEETRTALSSTVLSGPASSAPARRKRWTAALALGAVLTALAIWGAAGRFRSPAARVVPAAQAPLVAVPVEPAKPELAAAPVAPAPEAPEALVVDAAEVPSAQPSAAPPPAPPSQPKRSVAAPKPAPAKTNCTPPFVIGADGIKRFKPECFK